MVSKVSLRVAVGIIVIAFISVLFYPVGHCPTSERTIALSTIKQLTTSAVMYTSDYDDVEPPVQSMATYRSLLHPYTKNGSLWQALKIQSTPIRYNFSLSGIQLAEIDRPDKVVRLWCQLKAEESGKRFSVGFVDTSARFIREEKWESVRATMDLQWTRTVTEFLPPDHGADADPLLTLEK